jgi:hypothetical protein
MINKGQESLLGGGRQIGPLEFLECLDDIPGYKNC